MRFLVDHGQGLGGAGVPGGGHFGLGDVLGVLGLVGGGQGIEEGAGGGVAGEGGGEFRGSWGG